MKKEYVRAEMEIEYFETEDIITTSTLRMRGPLKAPLRMGGGQETPLDRIDPNNSSDWTNLPHN